MNKKSDRRTLSLPFAKYAIEQIERLKLPAEPQSFELWYTYATRQNPALNKAVDEALSSPTGLTEEKFDDLCILYLSSKRIRSQLGSVATNLAGEVSQVMGMLMAATVSSEAYEERLGEGLHNFEQADGHEALKPVVEALVMATREMESETQTLQLQLEVSETRTAQLQRQMETLRVENLTDTLTLIGNRQYFEESLTNLTAAATSSGKPLSLLFCDIDRFKDFNDRFGHQYGDQVLRLVASLIKDTLRADDVAARYGGEEFGILLPATPLDVAKTVADRLHAAVMTREVKKRGVDKSLGRITISIGVAQLREGEAPAALVQRADACLYAAKRAGRNRVVIESDRD